MKYVSAAVFCAVLLAFVVGVTVFPRDARTVENENRSFNRLPELSVKGVLAGSFAEGVEPWISDRVVRRADFISVALAVSNGYGAPPPSYAQRQPGEPEGFGRVRDPLLVFDDRLMRIFSLNSHLAAEYVAVINEYRAALPENVRIFSLLPPTQIEFTPERYRDISDSERDAIAAVYKSLDGGVIPVDAYSEIEAHRDEYLYFRTDHHWTALGAYYAYRAFSTAAGFEPKALSEYEETAMPDFLGFYFNMEPSERLRAQPDTIYYYRYGGALTTTPALLHPPGSEQKAAYSVFLGGDYPILRIATSIQNGKTAVIIKDSFANAFIPWLAPHYENIIVIDPRHFDGSAIDVINEYESADLIFLDTALISEVSEYIEQLTAALGTRQEGGGE